MAPRNLSSQSPVLPPSVNFHLWRPCNMRCRFCFATFEDTRELLPKGHLPEEQAVALVERLGAAGFRKITFAGGEPTLCPWLERLVRTARAAGMTTMLVTNGSRLEALPWVFDPQGPLDWVTLSIDSARPDTHAALGRALGSGPLRSAHYRAMARRLRDAGVRLKLNTVVTALNAEEDMSALVKALGPERYQLFSDACLALDAEVWRRPWRKEIERRLEAGERVVCTDVRTPEELATVRELGGEVWRVIRPGAGAPGSAAKHPTERTLAELPNRAFDVVLANTGTLETLEHEVTRVLGLA